jgi:ribonuclease HI
LPGHDATVPVPITLYTDGGCTGNEQPDAPQRVMTAVVSGADGTILVHVTRSGGSNNIAELWAVDLALRWAKGNGHKAVEIRTDSTNTLAWVQGRIGRKMNDRNAVLEAWSRINLLRRVVDLTLHWIPREQNLAGKFLEGYHITREPQVT